MEREKSTQETIIKAYESVVFPWTTLGMSPPQVSALEISRITGLSPGKVVDTAMMDQIFEVDEPTRSVYKKAVKKARYMSRAPGGGPVVKSGLKKEALKQTIIRLGKEKSGIRLNSIDTEDIRKAKRKEVKDRIELRWKSRAQSKKSNMNSREMLPQIAKISSYRQIIRKYDLFSDEGGITRKFRISPDLFILDNSLLSQLLELQDLFYSEDGILSSLSQRPAIIRLDLGLTPEKELKIFEIEGDKTNGFGYSECADLVRGKDKRFPGIAKVLCQLLDDKPLGIPLGQRFYKPEMIALARILRSTYGVNARAIDQNQVGNYQLLLNWPNSWGSTPKDKSFLIPRNRILDDKTFLAQLSETEQIRKYLPATRVVSGDNIDFWINIIRDNPESYIVKKAISSGASGVALDANSAIAFLNTAISSAEKFIVQERVQQKKVPFLYVEPEGQEIKSDLMYTRIEAYLSKKGLASVLVTARPELPVHGALDSIQISAITI